MTDLRDGDIQPISESELLEVTDKVSVPLSELEFRFSRGGGPGGQHANRSATRVELLFNITDSPSLTPTQKNLVLERLAGRTSDDGVLRVVAQSERSQLRNREEAVRRFRLLLRRALRVRKRRKKSNVPKWAKKRRLENKRRRGELKRSRGRVSFD